MLVGHNRPPPVDTKNRKAHDDHQRNHNNKHNDFLLKHTKINSNETNNSTNRHRDHKP